MRSTSLDAERFTRERARISEQIIVSIATKVESFELQKEHRRNLYPRTIGRVDSLSGDSALLMRHMESPVRR